VPNPVQNRHQITGFLHIVNPQELRSAFHAGRGTGETAGQSVFHRFASELANPAFP
jgi:hypothetical protein